MILEMHPSVLLHLCVSEDKPCDVLFLLQEALIMDNLQIPFKIYSFHIINTPPQKFPADVVLQVDLQHVHFTFEQRTSVKCVSESQHVKTTKNYTGYM